jgi:flagellar export protein FliJ
MREQAEKQAQEALAHELAVQDDCRTALTQVGERLRLAHEAGEAKAGGTASGAQLFARQAYVERIERERQTAAHGLAWQEKQVAAGRERLKLAAAEHEVMERLKQRRHAEHRRASDRAEESLLSEVALVRHRRAAAEARA